MARKDSDAQVYSFKKGYDSTQGIDLRRGRAERVNFNYYHVPKVEKIFNTTRETTEQFNIQDEHTRHVFRSFCSYA